MEKMGYELIMASTLGDTNRFVAREEKAPCSLLVFPFAGWRDEAIALLTSMLENYPLEYSHQILRMMDSSTSAPVLSLRRTVNPILET